MKRRLAGYDINGWRDFCARSWLERPGEEAIEDGEEIISGGELSQVVHSGQNRRHPYIGGAQAGLAPHGKGDGWGRIGQAERHAVRDLLATPFDHEQPLSASFQSLAHAPRVGVMAIPDHIGTTEEHQESYLSAMRQSGIRQPYLIWRPVLALLGALEFHSFLDHDRIGVVTQNGAGLSTQVLTLRNTGIQTPERRKTGILHPSEQSLDLRYRGAMAQLIEADSNGRRSDHIHFATTPGRIALGETGKQEVLRRKNGDWAILGPFELPLSPEPELFNSVAAHLGDCDHILLDVRMRPVFAAQLAAELKNACPQDMILLETDTVARGALEAARRLNRGDPAFFDFLPQITTLVQGPEGAVSHNLVPDNKVLPAGKIYRSRIPARFALLPGQDVISIYLRKENAGAPRLARIEGIEKVTQATEVSLTLEQQPVAGRARLTLSSTALPTPRVIDFDNAEEQSETWDEIIQLNKRKRPTIPERMVLPNGMLVWDGVANRRGLSYNLNAEASKSPPNWAALAGWFQDKSDKRHAINSDGELPARLSLSDEATLDQLIEQAKQLVATQLLDGTYSGNDALRFLTWTFRRCPQDIIPHMLEALQMQTHPITRYNSWRILVWQGLGRILQAPKDMMPVTGILCDLPVNAWKNYHVACMAFLVSRTDEALPLLSRADIEHLAKVVQSGLIRECGGGYTATFFYLPILLVGLLRWRMVDPWALVAGQDLAADQMAGPLDDIIQDLQHRAPGEHRLQRHLDLLRKSREELAGEGGHSHLLADLYGLTGGAGKN